MKKQKYFISLILVSMIIAGCASPAATEESVKMAEDPSHKEEAVDQSDDTSQSTSVILKETDITIDGNPSDWDGYDVLLTDTEGDHDGGGFDIAAVRAFSNDIFLYVLIETHQPPADYVQVDINASAGGRDYILSFQPQEFSTAFMGDVTSGQFEAIGEVAGSESAAAEAVEYKMPLSAFEDASNLKLSVRAMGGTCCEPPDWYAIDETEQVSVFQLDEIEPIMEPIAEIPAVPQVCGDHIAPPAPFGSLESAPISLVEEGYSAEWFVAPGEFNMPQQTFITPDGRLLIYSIRSHTLSQISEDGTVSLIAEDIWGYQGDMDGQGNIYLHFPPEGYITRVSPEGVITKIADSPKLQTPCDSGFGFGPDGNMYAAVSRCTDTSDMFQITPSGGISEMGEVPQINALRTAPDGRFFAATYDAVFELSIEDLTFSLIGKIQSSCISPGGMAVDEQMNIYISTGSRNRSGDLFRLYADTPQKEAVLVAEIKENGLSGIQWLPSTNEIVGGQLRQGGILAVSPSGEIRKLVEGNGIITPMGIRFSPCGELAVPNDDGGMMTLVNPAGDVSWFMDYLSFIPPIPYVGFKPDGTMYASEGEPMPTTPKRIIVVPPGGRLESFYDADLPSGLAYCPDGTLFVSETGAARITQINLDGSTSVLIEGIKFPSALAIDNDKNLYAITGPEKFLGDDTNPVPIGGDTLIQITPAGEIKTLLKLSDMSDIAFGPDGNIYVAAYRKIIQISPDGEISDLASNFQDAVGLAFDLAGNLYVSDEVANGIVRIGGFPQGTLSGVVTDETGTPIEDARVQVLSVDPIVVGQVVFTDKNGFFNLPTAPRSYQVIVKAENHQEYSLENLKVVADQETEIEISLKK